MYNILIVEDELFSQQALECSIDTIYPDKFNILVSDNGLDALDICQHQKPDIVLVDLNIPGISGLNLIQTLKDYDFCGKIIIITAYNRSKYIREAMSLGVTNYLLKPISLTELEKSIDKCLSLLAEENGAKKGDFDSLFSYAQSYLVHDILNCNAPQKLLSDVYGWAVDGMLDAGLLYWRPEKSAGSNIHNSYLNDATELFGKYFVMLSAVIQNSILIFLHVSKPSDTFQVQTILHTCVEMLKRKYPGGSLVLTEFVTTYSELYRTTKNCLFLAEHAPHAFLNETPSPTRIWSADDRLRLRQKLVQRLSEGQTSQLIQYLKRKFEKSDTPWAWVSLFMEALKAYDSTADLAQALTIFHSQNRFVLLEKWLYSLYIQKAALKAPARISKSQHAVMIIKQRFSDDISQEDIATELGLTPTYFSSLFKKETGMSFPQYLAEFRIKHAVSLILGGEENIDILVTSCGYHNKKYFLELFKKYCGCTITQFIHNTIKQSEDEV